MLESRLGQDNKSQILSDQDLGLNRIVKGEEVNRDKQTSYSILTWYGTQGEYHHRPRLESSSGIVTSMLYDI